MAADVVDADAGSQLLVALMEGDLVGIDLADHLAHVLDMIGVAQHAVAHVPPRRIGHLLVLQMQPRIAEVGGGAARS